MDGLSAPDRRPGKLLKGPGVSPAQEIIRTHPQSIREGNQGMRIDLLWFAGFDAGYRRKGRCVWRKLLAAIRKAGLFSKPNMTLHKLMLIALRSSARRGLRWMKYAPRTLIKC